MLLSLIRKELLIEFKSKEITASMLTFGVSIILIFSFAFNVSPDVFATFAPGLFWVMILFVSVLGLHRSFAYEKEMDAFTLLISSPVDRGMIFFAKWVSGTILLTFTEALIVFPFFLFLKISPPEKVGLAIGVTLLVNVAIMVIGSLVSGLAMRARLSEVLLPVLLFPLVSPVMIAAVKITTSIMTSQPFSTWQLWFRLIITFIVIFGLLGYALFDNITEE